MTDSLWRKRQEPVAWMKASETEWSISFFEEDGYVPLYTTPPQPKEQEPVAFYVYKPTLPRGNLGNVSDGNLPWVYDQDPSSGYSARMLVYTTPPQPERSMKVEGPLHVVCQCDQCKAQPEPLKPPTA